MHRLIREHFAPEFALEGLGDSALVALKSGRLAYTTDSYVVSPIFFPGGDIGGLSVYGTVNDLAVAGAMPLYLTAGFIIEEGFLLEDLKAIVSSMAGAARKAGVKIIAGDTKVVNRGKADGIFINTSGIGVMMDGLEPSPLGIKEGDAVLVSGQIGRHGIAIMAERNGITFDPPVLSDTAPLNGLVKTMAEAAKGIRFMRDPTRGGLATTLKEAALESGKCMKIKESSIPVSPRIRGACGLLGLDPLYVANEGLLIAIVEANEAVALLEAMKGHPLGKDAALIGAVEDGPEGMVLLETSIGGRRMLDMLEGEQLPRIC